MYRVHGAPIGIADPCAERGHHNAESKRRRIGMAIIPLPLLSVPFPPSRRDRKGGYDIFCVYILSCTYCDSFFAAVPSRTTHTYLLPSSPFSLTRVLHEPCVPGNGDERYMGSKLHTDVPTVGEARRGEVENEGRRRRHEGEGEEVWVCTLDERRTDATRGIEMREYQQGGKTRVCVERSARWHDRELDFSDSEFCSSFFLPLSLCPTRTLSSPIHPIFSPVDGTTFSPAYHSFLRPRALSTTTAIASPSFSFSPSFFHSLLLYIYIHIYNALSLSISRSPSGLSPRVYSPGDQTGGAADTIKRGKSDGQRTRTDVNGERKSPRRPCIRLPLRWRRPGQRRNRAPVHGFQRSYS